MCHGEFFGAVLNALIPSNSLAKRELARDCSPHAGLTPEIPATHGCTQSAEERIARDLSDGHKRRPWRTPSRILIREGASLEGKSDFAHCEIRSSRKIHVTGRFWLCRLCFLENSMRSTPAEKIFHALDSFRIGLQEARLPWFLQIKRDRLAEYKRRHRHVWPEMQAERANRMHELLAVRAR